MNHITPKRKRSKYNAIRTVIGNIAFHSRGEAHRWIELKHLENAGMILDLRRQVPFKLYAWAPEGQQVCIGTYKADFCYRDLKTNEEVVEDFKGAVTAHYRRTAKIIEANYGIKIKETRKI